MYLLVWVGDVVEVETLRDAAVSAAARCRGRRVVFTEVALLLLRINVFSH